jgi:hypothetical protein
VIPFSAEIIDKTFYAIENKMSFEATPAQIGNFLLKEKVQGINLENYLVISTMIFNDFKKYELIKSSKEDCFGEYVLWSISPKGKVYWDSLKANCYS